MILLQEKINDTYRRLAQTEEKIGANQQQLKVLNQKRKSQEQEINEYISGRNKPKKGGGVRPRIASEYRQKD